MKLVPIVLLLLVCIEASACLNGSSVILRSGREIAYDSEERLIPRGHQFDTAHFAETLKELDSLWVTTKDVDYRSDYGLILILQNKLEAAKRIYLEVEQSSPNRYSVAANLGTTYELLGKNDSAIIWIKRAIQIDSSSHYGSEWLHVKILEAKIGGPKLITSSFLINMDFGVEKEPISKISEKRLEHLLWALYYQLNERISFIKSEDPIIAQLLFDLGNVSIILDRPENAREIYNQAKYYGFKDSILELRYDYLNNYNSNPKVIWRNFKKNNPYIEWYFLGAIVVIGVVFSLIVKMKRRKRP